MANFGILGNHLKIIKEQFAINNNFIDILAYNSIKECLTIIELKKGEANGTVLAQVMKYFNDLKNIQIDNLIISSPPEIYILATEIAPGIIISPNMPIQFFKFFYDKIHDYIICQEVRPIIENYTNNDILCNFQYKHERTVHKKPIQEKLSKQIIHIIKNFYSEENLEIIEQKNKISIMNKQLIAKIIFPYSWFDDHIQLCIYNRFKKPFTYNDFKYDYNIKKIIEQKTLIKLDIIGIPQFISRLWKGNNYEF